jgi:hypothetical protein
MAVWYILWSFGIYFPIWYVWTKKNLATLGKSISEANHACVTNRYLRGFDPKKIVNNTSEQCPLSEPICIVIVGDFKGTLLGTS